jgi:3-oxoacyl-[acyl-carrier protein] reductase
MNTMDLQGRTAVVTGGAQGIGLAVARRLLAGGARVALWDADAPALAAAAQALAPPAGQLVGIQADITDAAAVDAACERTAAGFGGRIDILVHSAGIAGMNAPLAEYPLDEWRRVIEVNLHGAFLVNRAVVRRMLAAGYGRIVNIASIAGKEGNPNAAAYSASKAGLIALTKSLGKETAGRDIAVNAITPATAKTRILDTLTEEFIQYMLVRIPRGRFLEVDEAAAMVAWLVSKENSFTTASIFDLSGGRATY